LTALDNRRALRPPRRRGAGLAMVIAVMGIFAGVVWYSYPREAAREGEAPLVQADAGPYKTAPEDPGGMDIPNRDSTVFDTLRADNGGAEPVEHLLPPPEQPLPHEQVFAGLKTEVPASVMEGDTPEAAQAAADEPEAVASLPQPEEETTPAPVETAKTPAPVPAAKPAHVETAEKERALSDTAPASGAEAPKEAKGGYYAQLASVRSEQDAQAAWGRINKKYGGLFGDASHRVEKADLGARGVYYRLQAGPVSEAQARAICDAMGAKGGCLVVKR
jgi:cell division septation protein DedD